MKIALLGYGKMGKAIENIALERGHSIVLKINDDINNYNIRTADVAIDFSIPEAAVKNISKYLPKKRSLFEMEKGVPAHVKAAILYNDCLTHFKSPYKYEPMKDGDKIKWVYLKNNPLGLDGLAFNGWNDPPEILNFIETYIDHNKTFERELKKKLQDFYDAVGWGDVVSEQRSAEKFFEF